MSTSKKASEEKALRVFPILWDYATGLLEVTETLPARDLRHSSKNHFAFLAMCLSVTQGYHMRSVLALVDAELFFDAGAISRLMLEAMAIELWVAKDPDSRAHSWRLFALVMDYQLLQERLSRGEHVDPSKAASIRKRALTEASQFLTKRAKTALAAGNPLPSHPFLPRWHVLAGEIVNTKALFSEAGAEEQYRLYSTFSDWVHSNPRGVGQLLRRVGLSYGFSLKSVGMAVSALAASSQALAYALDMLDGAFSLELQDLSKLRARMHERMETLS